MSTKKMLSIRYRCLHPSCCVNCREGLITVEEGYFNELKAQCEEEDVFKSPRGACRLGFSQSFRAKKVEGVENIGSGGASLSIPVATPGVESEDPIAHLMADHKAILAKIEVIEEQVRKRDVEALWVSTCDIENHLNLHSGMKEEEVLVPELTGLLPLSEALTSIIKEDHREILSLLHSFRTGVAEGDIVDGLILSMIVSLKSHIRKEDYEFFAVAERHLDDDTRRRLMDGIRKVEAEFVNLEPGERPKKKSERRALFDEHILAVKDLVNTDGGCGCGE